MRNLLAYLFRCHHSHHTFPQTIGGRTHVTCLGCGLEREYDWARMKVAR